MDYATRLTEALAAAGWHVAASADTTKVLPAAVVLTPTSAARETFAGTWSVEVPVQFAVRSPTDLAHGIADLLARLDATADAIEHTGAAVVGVDSFGAATVAGQAAVAGTARLALIITP